LIALLAHPRQAPLVRLLAQRLPVAALCSPWRGSFGPLSLPVHTHLAELLAAHQPGLVCFLSPHPRLAEGLSLCLDREIRVLSAGPVEGPASPQWQWGGQHRFSPLVQQALAQSRSPDFGVPVYLRRVVGGGGLLEAWWAACRLLGEAQALLGGPPDWCQVAAHRRGQSHHLVLSLSFAQGACAHLVVAPSYPEPSADLTLLGSGGLVFSDQGANTPAVVSQAGAHLHAPAFLHPEPDWISDYLAGSNPPLPPDPLHLALLPAIRRSLRQGIPMAVLG